MRKIKAGEYEVTHNGHVYTVWRFLSEWGDIQWSVDRDDRPAWAQCDTLSMARITIEQEQ